MPLFGKALFAVAMTASVLALIAALMVLTLVVWPAASSSTSTSTSQEGFPEEDKTYLIVQRPKDRVPNFVTSFAWKFVNTGTRTAQPNQRVFTIQNASQPAKSLSVNGDMVAVEATEVKNPAQQWIITPVSGGINIQNKLTGSSLESAGVLSPTKLANCSQQWCLEPYIFAFNKRIEAAVTMLEA